MKQLKLILALGLFCFLVACDSEPKETEQTATTPIPTEIDIESPPPPDEEEKTGINKIYDIETREIWQKPELVLQFLGGLKGKTVADIGAGTGFFTFKMVEGGAEKVIAIDVDPYYPLFLDSTKIRRLPPRLQDRLETRLTTSDNPGLKKEEVDVVVIVNTFMYIENHETYLKVLKNGIKEGGKLLIIDFKKKRTDVGPPAKLREPLFQVEDELYEAGYKNVITNDCALDFQYIVIAEK